MSEQLVDKIEAVFREHPDHFEANRDIYLGVLGLLDQLERNHCEFKIAQMNILSSYPESPTMSKDEMDNVDIAFLEVLEPYDDLRKLFGLSVSEPEGY